MNKLTCPIPWGRGRGKPTHRGYKTQTIRGGNATPKPKKLEL